MNTLSAYAKGVGALVLTVLVNLVTNLVNSETPIPQNGGEWATLIVSALAVSLGVVVIPNTTTDPIVARNQSVALKPGRHALPE